MFTIKHPRTKEPDSILTLTCFVVVIAAIKFFFEGVNVHISGHTFDFGHADAGVYMAILGPVLGAHATREWKGVPKTDKSGASDA